MSLIDKLKAGKNNIKQTVWPGTTEPVGIVVLTDAESQEAQFATELLFKQRGLDFNVATADTYQAEQNTQVLARAIFDLETKKPLFKNADELRGLITHPDVKAALITEYLDWQRDCSPAMETMTEEQYDALFAEVKKNPSILTSSNSRTLRGLIIYLAERQQKLAKASGSTS
jgi:hypothetical protein